jgi:SEC-C motif domain protein
MSQVSRCPCGNASYAQCCEPLHTGAVAQTPVALMRSRYSAYAKNLIDYLRYSWHPDTCPSDFAPDLQTCWLGLDILNKSVAADQQSGTVKFSARFRDRCGNTHRLVENSVFVRFEGRWVYLKAQ